MPQPVLRTERLVMVPLSDGHLELEVQLDADAEVLKYLWKRPRSRAEVTASHGERMQLGREVDGLGYWVAFRRTDGKDTAGAEFIGLMMLPPDHPEDRPVTADAAALGYRIARKHWRQGFASEAAGELLRHAFETVGVPRVVADTMAVNTGSRAVLARVGMRYVRTHFVEFDDPLPGTDQGEVLYQITRKEWRSRH
ncbi:GNAT family N-acetyltransferase [Flexivirga oryzae]|uniref:RimJ/RimL family protein N-acetyltransferase n=1 Tax=Flexivirga oryzae TaxID=1794944 RepID=A0A839N9K4_9MICO|nr:GNAT family N-acetyltransferase [Flexivirga oryzae]MBB2892863.1 RimJ/RimL family protein N-acetyltransferase [Flexivirga oryzae]